MADNFEVKIVDFTNALEAINIQRSIFLDDGLMNILNSLDYSLFLSITGLPYPDDHVKYYLAYLNGIPMGITGLYYYPGYDDEMWLAWFGILPEYQGKGYGKKLLEWSMNKVKESNRKILRLYTDETNMQVATSLYTSMGFIHEKYNGEELDYNCYIYSKSLTDEPVSAWNDKFLGLATQSEFEREDDEFKERILNIYKEKYLK